MNANKELKRLERGWAGHFICADRCLFRRNTLLTYGEIEIVVSTVGLMLDYHAPGFPNTRSFDKVGLDCHYETMAFHAKKDDVRYKDADVTKHVSFNCNWCIEEIDADDRANDMHEDVVNELSERLLVGDTFPVNE